MLKKGGLFDVQFVRADNEGLIPLTLPVGPENEEGALVGTQLTTVLGGDTGDLS